MLEAVAISALYAVGPAGDAMCAEVVEVVLYVFEVLNACAVPKVLEVVPEVVPVVVPVVVPEVVPKVLEVPEAMRCVLICSLEAVEGWLCLLEMPKVAEVMRCVPLYMLEAVEGGL